MKVISDKEFPEMIRKLREYNETKKDTKNPMDIGYPITNIGERLSDVLSEDSYQKAIIKGLSQ